MNFRTKDNIIIYVKSHETLTGKAKGVVQIAHGMAEHIGRYDYFAETLNRAGFYVYGNDHRGHGRSVTSMSELGILAKEEGFSKMVEDLYTLSQKIKEKHSELPLFLFGHSMGSFLAQRYIMLHGNMLKAAILSGSNGENPRIKRVISKLLLARSIKKHGRNGFSKDLDQIVFSSYTKKIKHPKTRFDWLSRDDSQVNTYINDPFCGFLFSVGGFQDLFSGLELITEEQEIEKIPKELSLLLISGKEDPVGNYGKGVKKLRDNYYNHGIKNLEMNLYDGARHELLNELNKDNVIEDLIDYLNRRIDS